MSSKRGLRRRRWQCCPTKEVYEDEVVAEAAAVRARLRTGERISWYRCPRCQGLHLGHTPAGLRRAPELAR